MKQFNHVCGYSPVSGCSLPLDQRWFLKKILGNSSSTFSGSLIPCATGDLNGHGTRPRKFNFADLLMSQEWKWQQGENNRNKSEIWGHVYGKHEILFFISPLSFDSFVHSGRDDGRWELSLNLLEIFTYRTSFVGSNFKCRFFVLLPEQTQKAKFSQIMKANELLYKPQTDDDKQRANGQSGGTAAAGYWTMIVLSKK